MRNRRIIILMVIAMAVCLIGCGKEEDLTGRWVYSDENMTVVLELFSDGTGTSDDGTTSNTITWLAENDRIKFTYDFGLLGKQSYAYDYTLKKDTLTIMNDEGEPVEYKRNVDVSQIKAEINKEGDSKSEKVIEESIKFSCMDEIKAASLESGLLQIDDMVLQYRSKCSEIISVIEQSECMYVAEYNLHSAVPARESVSIHFYKDGEPYFSILAKNYEEETIELKNCVVYSISVSNAAIENTFYAGFDDGEKTYTTVKETMEGYEPEKELFGSDSRGNDELGVLYTIPFQDKELHIYFIFDGVTDKLIAFMLNEHIYETVSWPW